MRLVEKEKKYWHTLSSYK